MLLEHGTKGVILIAKGKNMFSALLSYDFIHILHTEICTCL